MNIRSLFALALLVAGVALIPAASFAQTATPPAPAAPTVTLTPKTEAAPAAAKIVEKKSAVKATAVNAKKKMAAKGRSVHKVAMHHKHRKVTHVSNLNHHGHDMHRDPIHVLRMIRERIMNCRWS